MFSDTVHAAVEMRRDLHQHPEPGFQEKRTHDKLREHLRSFGIEDENMRTMATTGLVVDIVGTGTTECKGGAVPADDAPGGRRIVAIRSDIDALPMTEQNETLPWRSTNAGAAHMCGHDGHMASLLGAVSIMARNRDRLPSNCAVRLLFQPAEEGPGGAEPMIREGCLTGVSEVYGYHNWPTMELGKVHVKEGAMMARVTDIDITLRGSGVHASQPQNGLDPVVAASQLVTALQTIVSRNLDPAKSAVLSISVIRGGEARNVIPDTVHLEGTLRTFADDVHALVTGRIRTMTEGMATAMGVRAEVELRDAYPVLYNAKEPTDHVRRVARGVVGDDAVRDEDLPVFGAEDFGYFAQHRPGCFFFLGSAEPGRQTMTLHQSKYDFNDRVLPIAMLMWLRLVEDRLGASWTDLPAAPDVNLVPPSEFHSLPAAGAGAGAGKAAAGGGRGAARGKRPAADTDSQTKAKRARRV